MDRQTILVVEDDPLVRIISADLLENEGFDIVVAADASEAIDVLERRTDIRAIFTDIDMPGSIDRLMLASVVRDRWPPIAIFVTSGKAPERADALPPDSQFFIKPYNPRELVQALSRAIAN